MERWPVNENGIALPPYEIRLPEGRGKKNNHHGHWTSTRFARSATLLSLRDLERHQYPLAINTHKWLHDHYAPPELPSEEQAAREVIDAYDQGEQFKRYDRYSHGYFYENIPKDITDEYVAMYGLGRVIYDMAAD